MATTKKAPAKKKAVAKSAAAPRTPKEAAVKAGEAVIYTMTGKEAGSIALPAELFAAQWNADLVHQVVTGMQANARQVTAHTKFRGEVSGGGKKPWKQKGTGRARHGSTRSPIWKGGGVTHGPRAERDYSVKINRKMRSAALVSLLSKKLKDGEVVFVDSLAFAKPATAEAVKALGAIGKAAKLEGLMTKAKNSAVIALAGKDVNAEKSLRNIGNVTTEEIRNLNVVDLATKKYLIIERPTEAVAALSARIAKN
jgi:large subunit ribosomal protein L4